jgi:hypothetical protein
MTAEKIAAEEGSEFVARDGWNAFEEGPKAGASECLHDAIFAAKRTASTRLLPFALPCQAMSHAVP